MGLYVLVVAADKSTGGCNIEYGTSLFCEGVWIDPDTECDSDFDIPTLPLVRHSSISPDVYPSFQNTVCTPWPSPIGNVYVE